MSQNVIYREGGKRDKKVIESVWLDLNASSVAINQTVPFDPASLKELGFFGIGEVIDIAEKIISLGYKVTTDILEARVKKFSGEYEKENSYLECGTGALPEAEFVREVKVKGETFNALTFKLAPGKAEGLNYFYYSISDFKLQASKAKSTGKSSVFDYSIEVHLTYVKDTAAHEITLPPIQLHSVGYDSNPLSTSDPLRYRTDLIPIPKDAYIVKLGVKVVETNPQKVSAQKFLDIWNSTPEKYKDNYAELKGLLIKTED